MWYDWKKGMEIDAIRNRRTFCRDHTPWDVDRMSDDFLAWATAHSGSVTLAALTMKLTSPLKEVTI